MVEKRGHTGREKQAPKKQGPHKWKEELVKRWPHRRRDQQRNSGVHRREGRGSQRLALQAFQANLCKQLTTVSVLSHRCYTVACIQHDLENRSTIDDHESMNRAFKLSMKEVERGREERTGMKVAETWKGRRVRTLGE